MAVIMAISMTLLAVCTGLVLDFGLVRMDRTSNKLTADAAVSGGLLKLYDIDDERKPWQAVCSAIQYVKANDPEFATTTGTFRTGALAPDSNACTTGSTANNRTCLPNTPATWARWDATSPDGDVTVQIRSGYTLPDPSFPEDTALAGDNGQPLDGGCDQLAVIIRETRQPGLGSLASTGTLVTQIRSVGRATVDSSKAVAPAMLLLERTACQVLTAGSTNTYVLVKGVGTAPGLIHADSTGANLNSAVGPTCGSNKVFEGKFAAHIKAQKAPTGGVAGSITTVAMSTAAGAVAANAYDSLLNVVAENGAVAEGDVIGRTPVDKRYALGVRTAIDTAAMTYAAAPAGFTTLTNCGNGVNVSSNASLIYINCPTNGIQCASCDFPNAQQVIVNGWMSVKNGNSAKMPLATKVYINGQPGGVGLDVNGSFSLHDRGAAACGTSTERTQLVISNGAFTGGSPILRLCNTTVLMGDGYASTCPVPVGPPYTVVPAAPINNVCHGYVYFGGTPVIDWTAPNVVPGPSNTAAWSQLEDLGLWTESSGLNSTTTSFKIGGGSGIVRFTGVFFIPNANPFELGGQAAPGMEFDAQFITRRLTASGQGSITLTPDPNNSVTVPLPPAFSLVR